jgi:hypothetical protein
MIRWVLFGCRIGILYSTFVVYEGVRSSGFSVIAPLTGLALLVIIELVDRQMKKGAKRETPSQD